MKTIRGIRWTCKASTMYDAPAAITAQTNVTSMIVQMPNCGRLFLLFSGVFVERAGIFTFNISGYAVSFNFSFETCR